MNAATEDMNRIRPNPRAAIPGSVRWASRNGARRLTAIISSKSAAVTSSSDCLRPSPALLTSTETGPSACSTAVTSSPGASGRLRPAPSAMAVPPAAVMSAAVRSAAYWPCP